MDLSTKFYALTKQLNTAKQSKNNKMLQDAKRFLLMNAPARKTDDAIKVRTAGRPKQMRVGLYFSVGGF